MRALPVFFLVVSSLGCPTRVEERCFSVEPLETAGRVPIVLQSGVASVRLDAVLACPFPMTVEVEVQDPSSRVLEAAAVLSQQPSRIAADVSFTPTVPGRYLVIGRFQPSMEVVQVLVEVAKRRPAPEEPRLVDAMPFDPAGCDGLGRTASGSVVCQQRASTLVIRDGGITDQVLPGSVFVSGNTVWVARAQQVDRYLDDAGTLVPMGRVTPLQSFAPNAGFFADDTAILVDGDSPRGPFRFDGGAVVDEQKPFPPSARAVFMLGSKSFALAGDGLCEVRTGPPSCIGLFGIAGVSDDAVWVNSQLNQVLEVRRADLVTPQLSRAFRGFDGVELSPGPISATSVPRLRASLPGPMLGLLAPRMEKNNFVVEAWPDTTRQLGRQFVLVEQTPQSLVWVVR